MSLLITSLNYTRWKWYFFLCYGLYYFYPFALPIRDFHATLLFKRIVLLTSRTKLNRNYLHFSVLGVTWAKQGTIWTVASIIFTHPFFTKSTSPTICNQYCDIISPRMRGLFTCTLSESYFTLSNISRLFVTEMENHGYYKNKR